MVNKATILLVEDEENLHEALKLNLELDGYEVTSAYDGKLALEAVNKEFFNLIILKGILYHIDLYRLKDSNEALSAGVEDCLFSGNYCFVEWPERATDLFPQNTVSCFLHVVDADTRLLKIIM